MCLTLSECTIIHRLNTFLRYSQMTTLVLNADAQPVSLLPLSIVGWQEAIRYLVLDKVTVMDWYDDWIVRSAN